MTTCLRCSICSCDCDIHSIGCKGQLIYGPRIFCPKNYIRSDDRTQYMTCPDDPPKTPSSQIRSKISSCRCAKCASLYLLFTMPLRMYVSSLLVLCDPLIQSQRLVPCYVDMPIVPLLLCYIFSSQPFHLRIARCSHIKA